MTKETLFVCLYGGYDTAQMWNENSDPVPFQVSLRPSHGAKPYAEVYQALTTPETDKAVTREIIRGRLGEGFRVGWKEPHVLGKEPVIFAALAQAAATAPTPTPIH